MRDWGLAFLRYHLLMLKSDMNLKDWDVVGDLSCEMKYDGNFLVTVECLWEVFEELLEEKINECRFKRLVKLLSFFRNSENN